MAGCEQRLQDLLADPGRVAEIPFDQIPALLAQLGGLQGALLARLAQPQRSADRHAKPDESDQMITVAEAAARLGVTDRWLYRHADQLPFTRRLSRKALRFSDAGLRRWLAAKRP